VTRDEGDRSLRRAVTGAPQATFDEHLALAREGLPAGGIESISRVLIPIWSDQRWIFTKAVEVDTGWSLPTHVEET